MQRLELDFIRRGPRSRWAGRVLLAVGVGMALDMAVSYVQLERAMTALRSAEA